MKRALYFVELFFFFFFYYFSTNYDRKKYIKRTNKTLSPFEFINLKWYSFFLKISKDIRYPIVIRDRSKVKLHCLWKIVERRSFVPTCLTSTKRIIQWIVVTRFEFTMFNERYTQLNKKDLLRSSSSSSFERYNLNCRVSIISSIKSYYFSMTVVPNNFSNKLIFTVSRFYCYT